MSDSGALYVDTTKPLTSTTVRSIFLSSTSEHEAQEVADRPPGGHVKLYGADIVSERDYIADNYPWNYSYRAAIKDPMDPSAPPILSKVVHLLRVGNHDAKTKRAPSDRTFQRHTWTILPGSQDHALLEHKDRAVVHYVGQEPVSCPS